MGFDFAIKPDFGERIRDKLAEAVGRFDFLIGELCREEASGSVALKLNWAKGDLASWTLTQDGARPELPKKPARTIEAALVSLADRCHGFYLGRDYGRGYGNVTVTAMVVDGQCKHALISFCEHVGRID